MARNAHKLVSAQGEVVSRSGKIRHCIITVNTSAIILLREGDITGNIIYKLDVTRDAQHHQDLDLAFKGALFAEFVSGTGEFNLIYE